MSAERRLLYAARRVRVADDQLRAADAELLGLGHEVDSVVQALGEARVAVERASDGLAWIARINCPHCAPDEPCALHTGV